MKINVRNNDVVKAYKILTKKINDEGLMKSLKAKEYYLTKSQKVKVKKKIALSRFRKEQKKKRAILEKQEQNFLLYSKKSGNQPNRRYS